MHSRCCHKEGRSFVNKTSILDKRLLKKSSSNLSVLLNSFTTGKDKIGCQQQHDSVELKPTWQACWRRVFWEKIQLHVLVCTLLSMPRSQSQLKEHLVACDWMSLLCQWRFKHMNANVSAPTENVWERLSELTPWSNQNWNERCPHKERCEHVHWSTWHPTERAKCANEQHNFFFLTFVL